MSTPAAFAASRIDVPAGTETRRPSIVRLTPCVMYGSASRHGRHEMMRLLRDERLEITPELLQSGDNRRCARIAQDTDRLARHVVGDLEQRVEILGRAVARGDALENLRRPGRPFPALRALGATLVGKETRGAGDELDEVLRIVDDDHAAGAEHRALRDESLVVHERRFGL